MLRAIIIDDEPVHRMGIVRHVNWQELGYEAPLQAQGAEEALQIIKKKQNRCCHNGCMHARYEWY